MTDRTWEREKYPWASMLKIGDSFSVPENKHGTARQLVHAANKRLGDTYFKWDSKAKQVIKVK